MLIVIKGYFHQREGFWVASLPHLGLHGKGESQKASLDELIKILLLVLDVDNLPSPIVDDRTFLVQLPFGSKILSLVALD